MGAPPPAPPGDAQVQQAGKLNTEGWELWKKRDLDAAEEKFAEAVKIDPTFSAAWNGLGWSRFNNGKYDTAETAFLKAVQTDDSNAAALNGLGQLYYQQNKLDKAKEYLTKAAPNAPAAWWGLAKLALIQGDFDEAQKWSQKIVDSGDTSANELLSAAKAKKLDDKLRAQIAPAPAGGQEQVAGDVQRGWKLWQQGRGAQARVVFENYLKNHPDDANAINGLGWALISTAKPAEAQKQFEKCLSIDKTAAGAMNGLAVSLKNQKKLDEAIKVWEDMVKNVPGVHAGTYGLADAYMEKKQFDKALPLYEQIVQANPDDAKAKQKLERAKNASAHPS